MSSNLLFTVHILQVIGNQSEKVWVPHAVWENESPPMWETKSPLFWENKEYSSLDKCCRSSPVWKSKSILEKGNFFSLGK
jgi:hypothetical protein